VNWIALENAIAAEIRAPLAEYDGVVIWRDQTRTRPRRVFATLAWQDAAPTAFTAPVVCYEATPGQPPGQELTEVTMTSNTLSVEVQVMCTDITGDTAALALAVRIAAELEAPDTLERLGAAGIAVRDVGRVQNISELLQTEHESRAVFAVSLDTVTETRRLLSYVERVGVTIQTAQHGQQLPAKTFDVPTL
jgi:hypothetical protein